MVSLERCKSIEGFSQLLDVVTTMVAKEKLYSCRESAYTAANCDQVPSSPTSVVPSCESKKLATNNTRNTNCKIRREVCQWMYKVSVVV